MTFSFDDAATIPTATEGAEAPAATPQTAASRRRKLWQLRQELHCSIIGTCLSMPELHAIAKRAGFPLSVGWTDYEIHGLFTAAARKKCGIAKFTHKTLESKYATAIRQFRPAETEEELRALWNRCWSRCDVPGPYWAAITHPAVTSRVIESIFGQVHMLSHLSGASRLVDAQRLEELSAQVTGLEEERNALRRRLVDRDRTLNGYQALKRNYLAQQHEIESLRSKLAAYESEVSFEALRASARRLSESSEACRTRIRKLEEDLRIERAANAALRRSRSFEADPSSQLSLGCELSRGGDSAHRPLAADSDDADEASGDPADLSGRRVLYVGGRPGTVAHLRTLIENHNGTFLHHDGGKEERGARLDDALNQADLVVCPTDCISHAASLRAKAFCKSADKPFLFLRTASLSSLAKGLHEIAKRVGDDRYRRYRS